MRVTNWRLCQRITEQVMDRVPLLGAAYAPGRVNMPPRGMHDSADLPREIRSFQRDVTCTEAAA